MKLFGIWGLVFSVSFLEKFDEGAIVWVYGFEGERKEKRLIMEMTKLSDGIFVGYYYERVITEQEAAVEVSHGSFWAAISSSLDMEAQACSGKRASN
ncbi:hypothetical protein WN944_019960 [Citrus x changshan-huyou]|uniref:Uncharacterized protein n=1 Tax=Citrus x changshan-huyou TaxID=2935761 RepID=A0AAP0QK13_9ROSI